MKNRNRNLKILLATEICVFDCLVAFIATAAWFTAQRLVTPNADAFQVTDYMGLVKNISIYPLQNPTTNYVYSSTAKVSYDVRENGKLVRTTENEDPFSMGLYDQLDTPYNSVLYIFTIDTGIAKEQKKINITAKTTGKEVDSPLNQGQLKETGNSLSSIVRFYKMNDDKSDAMIDTVTDERIFDFTSRSLADPCRFYTLKTSDITNTYIESYKDSFSFIRIDGLDTYTASEMYIEFICDYDTDALEGIYNLNVGSELLDSGKTIRFTQDWSMEIK